MLVTMTMVRGLSCQTSLQKSTSVQSLGPAQLTQWRSQMMLQQVMY